MTFFHVADRWKRQGFPRSAVVASCSGRRVPQSARAAVHAALRFHHGSAAPSCAVASRSRSRLPPPAASRGGHAATSDSCSMASASPCRARRISTDLT